jgi:hypothetical protein
VERETKDTKVYAIKMVAILTHSELVLKISMVQERLLIPPSHSPLLLNSSLKMEQILVT